MKPEKVKSFIAGILAATGSWMWVVNLREYLIKVSPISNQYVIGLALIIAAALLVKK